MFEHLTTHARVEGQMLDGYLAAAESSNSKAFAYVVGMLVDDERRHHRYFSDLAKSLKADAELGGEEPVVPHLDFHHADREALLELTRQLIANEETDAVELKRLRKEMRDLEDTTLWALLVDTMQLDTAKHLTLLRFVERHAAHRF
jgi:rubrerythrin